LCDFSLSLCLTVKMTKKFVDEFSGNFSHDVTVNMCRSYISKY